MPCENCGRTFLPDRLEVHLRSCAKLSKKINPEEMGQIKPGSGSMNSQPQNNIFGTPNLNNKAIKGELSECTMCGRTFSKNMMENHVKACQKRWTPN